MTHQREDGRILKWRPQKIYHVILEVGLPHLFLLTPKRFMKRGAMNERLRRLPEFEFVAELADGVDEGGFGGGFPRFLWRRVVTKRSTVRSVHGDIVAPRRR